MQCKCVVNKRHETICCAVFNKGQWPFQPVTVSYNKITPPLRYSKCQQE